MCLGLRQIRRKCSPQDSRIKKAPRQNQLVPKKGPSQNLMKVKRGCFGAFLLWRKEKHFLQLFMTHYTYLKTTGIFGGQFEGSLWVEMKFIQRVNLSFRKGSNQLSSGVKDTSQGWIVGIVSPCRYWPAASFAHPDSRAEAVYVLLARLTYLSLSAATAGEAGTLWS